MKFGRESSLDLYSFIKKSTERSINTDPLPRAQKEIIVDRHSELKTISLRVSIQQQQQQCSGMTNNEEKYNKERLEKVLGDSLYDVDQWCEELIMMDSSTTLELQHNRPHELLLTPKTRWFNLSLEQANALVHHYQQHVLKHANKMTNSDEMEIQKLEEQIRNVWNQEKRFLGKKVFCRLSTRSPKDAALFDGSDCYRRCKILLKKKWIASYLKFKERKGQLTSTQISRDYILNTETEDFENYVTNVMSHSEEYLSFMQCSQQALAVENERQVIDVLTNSERVLQDLARALEFPEVFNMKLILREWYPEITYEYEFRGFVHNFELIALCQYDNTCLVQELIDKKDEIASSILRYYNTTVKPVLLCKSKQSTSVISKWNGEGKFGDFLQMLIVGRFMFFNSDYGFRHFAAKQKDYHH